MDHTFFTLPTISSAYLYVETMTFLENIIYFMW